MWREKKFYVDNFISVPSGTNRSQPEICEKRFIFNLTVKVLIIQTEKTIDFMCSQFFIIIIIRLKKLEILFENLILC